MLMRVGEQFGAGEYALENRIPWAASRSRFGDEWLKIVGII
jgi:hypothetical protein